MPCELEKDQKENERHALLCLAQNWLDDNNLSMEAFAEEKWR